MRSMTMNMGTTKALRAASGNLAARRGSTLILVVATLALLAVLTVAYVSIGGGDRRSARTTTRAAEIERQAQHIGDYIVGIIGDDALSVYFEGFDPDGQPIFMTEAVDLPRTDFNRTFDGSPVGGTPDPQSNYYGLAFTPTGSLPPLRASDDPTRQASNLFTAGGALKPFGPSDPFLAASEPTYIRQRGGAFSNPAYLDRKDWAKVSNIGPNGLYVNLWNLRENFDAEPGVATAGQMSHESTMFVTDRNGNAVRNLAYGGTADPRIPAHFDSMLVGAFQPVNFVPTGVEVQDPEYPAYSWADADADGFFDSRWQELVDISAGSPRRVVPSEGQLRWFVASRIVDLSSRVNVNTARGILQPTGSGLVGAPTNGDRLGASPADIDLLRLLALENNWAMFDEFYDTAIQPGGGVEDYSDYDDYSVAKSVGTEAYGVLRRVLRGEQPPGGPLAPAVDPQQADERRAEYAFTRRGGGVPLRSDLEGVYRDHAFGLEDLSDLLAFNGLNNPQSLSSLERATGGRDSSTSVNFGPLRDNRSLQVERSLSDPDAAQALRHASVRKDLTTLSGGIPRVPWRVRYPSASPTAFELFTSFSSLPDSTVAVDPSSENPSVIQDGYRLLTLGAPIDLPTGGTVAEAQARLLRNAHPLLRTYGNALMPAAAEPGAWSEPAWASTFYGFDPLFALRTSAHMVANMIDAYDGDDIPSAFTVRIDGNSAARVALENDPAAMAAFPWWSEPEPASSNPGISGRLDMGDERLPVDAAGTQGVVAMNVYGLEVHPFITQVSLYNIFTDAPEAVGGDQDFMDPGPGGGGTIFAPGGGSSANNIVTIDFDTDQGNADFVGQLFAVQLTNPYSTDIIVRDNQYYVRFGELGGPTTSPALADGLEVPAGTRIPAGESVVFYAQTDDLPGRANRVAAFTGVSTTQVESWINLHLTGDSTLDAVQFATSMMGVGDFLGGVAGAVSGDADANREVTLWTRLNRDGGEVSDVMLDRLYDPADLSERPTLDRRPPAVNTNIDATTTGPETGTAAEALDNTGFSIVTWGTIARPTGSVEAPRGTLPAYILEKPFNDSGMSLNGVATDDLTLPAPPSPGLSINRGSFVGGGKLRSAERYLADIFTNTDGSTGMTAQIPTDIALQAGQVDPMAVHQHRYVLQPSDQSDGLAFEDLYVNPFRNDNRGALNASATTSVRMLRPGDFLGVPAVGPVQMPANFSGGVDPLVLDWFTTGELLTLALGYDVAPPSGSGLFYPSLPLNTYNLLDRGHLSLDLPAPFVDLDNTGDFTPGDERRGLGIPHAMAVTSSITTLDVPINTRTPIAGVVNLNTATEAVTSVLPGLTPTYESIIDPAYSQWFSDGATVLHDHRSDVGAGIRSYRDRSAARTRRGTTTMTPFYDTASWGDSDPNQLDDRQATTGIAALREDTGFLSVGEMLAADTLPGGGGVGGPSTYLRPHMIRRLGQDQFSLNIDGVDSIRYTAGGAVDVLTAAPGFDDGVADDYDEQLALFNGVANTVSVRSDVFAVWFVMHGYAREDVEGLRDGDPMTPSVARRYLMVVDRSNVRQAGDKPRVLLFDELPL